MKNGFWRNSSGLLTALLLIVSVARADDLTANLQIKGTIQASTCDVIDSSQNLTVNIGDFSTPDFPTVGSTGAEKSFSIELSGCTYGIAGAKTMFSGTADASNPNLLALSDTSGGGEMATGVAVEILNARHQTVPINNSDAEVYTLKEGDNTLSFFLRYKSTSAMVTAGNASAVMYFDLQYQ
jgi:type 1 fimbria pilin